MVIKHCAVNAQTTNIKLLIDTPYKIAAHYLPPLVMRTLLYNEIPLKAKDFKMERKIYISALQAEIKMDQDPMRLPNLKVSKEDIVESIEMTFKSSWRGLLGRKIEGSGKLNELDISFLNLAKANPIFRNAFMESHVSVNDIKLFDIEADVTGSDKEIKVKGQLLGKKVNYSTIWRNTKGELAGFPFELYVEGLRNDDDQVTAITSSGKIANYVIKGYAKKVNDKLFEIQEYYGPLYIETKLEIL